MCSDAIVRAAPRVFWFQCVLLASIAWVSAVLAAGVPAIPSPPAVARATPSSPLRRSGTAGTAAVPPPTAAEAGLPPPPGAPASAAQPLPPEDLLFACPTTLDYLGRVVAAVTIDGKGPFRFVVDTGANYSTISPQLVALLGLKPSLSQAIRVTGITGSAQFASVPIEMLKAGDLEIADTRFPVIWSPMMAGAAGILGAAGLSHDRLIVDFRRNKVEIARSRGQEFPWGFTRVWATRLPGGLLSIPGRVGDVRVRAIIDTGSQHTLGNLALYRALYAHQRGKGHYKSADVYGATRQVGTGKLQLAPLIDLGAIKISGVALVFGGFHIFKAWHLTDQPTMILGMDVLGTVNAFAIDFKYGEFAVHTMYQRDSLAALPADASSSCPAAAPRRSGRCGA